MSNHARRQACKHRWKRNWQRCSCRVPREMILFPHPPKLRCSFFFFCFASNCVLFQALEFGSVQNRSILCLLAFGLFWSIRVSFFFLSEGGTTATGFPIPETKPLPPHHNDMRVVQNGRKVAYLDECLLRLFC